jgi:non-specific serine/threonine protein kinase
MDSRERDESLRAFKSDPAITVLLCSSRVGGEGLTLVEANHVIFFNEWWNPSANAQARDRVIRIGQIRGVHVYRFRCQGTIEESLDEILERKSGTMSELIDRIAESAPTPDVIKDLVKKLRIKL